METTLNLVVRKYVDVNGQQRRLIRVQEDVAFVKWKKGSKPSLATRWRDESGSIIQIPNNAWSEQNIKYTDSVERYDGKNL